MNTTSSQSKDFLESVFCTESRQVLSTLIRLLGDFDLAEDALQDAFAAASEKWPVQGIPANPRAWLVSVGRFRGIDAIRRRSRVRTSLEEAPEQSFELEVSLDDDGIDDDLLRLIFTCCHPVLAEDAKVALTLREVCGLTTEEIASAFLASPSTLAQRIVRAKAKLRDAKVPYEVPVRADLPERLDSVLRVTYLVFNEGYYSSSGYSLTRKGLSGEGIRVGRLLAELLPEPEVLGLLALMLFSEARRDSRSTPSGDVILLSDQDRSLWDKGMIQEGLELIREASASGQWGPYAIQAAISAVHASSPTAESTDWAQIVRYYDLLVAGNRSPVIALNRAVAVAMSDGPEKGLDLIDNLMLGGKLDDYGLAHSARADLCRRLGQRVEAAESYRRALKLAKQEPERRFLQRRLSEIS